MAKPFKPTLVSPGQRGASSPASVTFRFQFNGFGAGETMGAYVLRRYRVSPTVGSFEYWTGSTWSATETWVTPGTTVNDKDFVSVTISTGWTTGQVYQWTVDTRDTATSTRGGFANTNLLDVHTAPTVAAAPSSTGETRPQIVWQFTGGAGRRQKSYRWYVYSSSVYNAPGFDPASSVWQSQAVWGMPVAEVGSQIYKKRISYDLANGTNYRMYGLVTDDTDLSSGWVNAGNFTPSYTSQSAPTVTVTPDPANGRVGVGVSASFNLLSEEASAFTSSVGPWSGDVNCDVSLNTNQTYSKSGNSLRVVVGGGDYSYLDTTHTTYDAMDTAYSTYEAQRTTQQPGGEALLSTGNQISQYANVLASTVHSAIASVFPLAAESVQLRIRWYQSNGSPSSITAISSGTLVSCPAGVWTDVSITGATSPSDASYAKVEIRMTTWATDDIVYIDNVALAAAASIQWSAGGTSVDVGFVIQRSSDGGATWKYIWNNSHDTPFSTVSQTVFSGQYTDRNPPIGSGLPLIYRVTAVARKSTQPLYSSWVDVPVSAMEAQAWWLRSVNDSTKDMKILASKFGFSEAMPVQSFAPENATAQVVVQTATPSLVTLDGTIWLVSSSDYSTALALLRSSDTLYLQRNIGDGFYFRCTSVNTDQRASVGNGITPRHVHTLGISGIVVSEPSV